MQHAQAGARRQTRECASCRRCYRHQLDDARARRRTSRLRTTPSRGRAYGAVQLQSKTMSAAQSSAILLSAAVVDSIDPPPCSLCDDDLEMELDALPAPRVTSAWPAASNSSSTNNSSREQLQSDSRSGPRTRSNKRSASDVAAESSASTANKVRTLELLLRLLRCTRR